MRLLIKTLFLCLIQVQTFAQEPKLRSTSWRENWQVEFKTGIAALMSPVPDKYLKNINYVNIPIRIPGPAGIFTARKSITSHLMMGYQFDYIRIQGKVEVQNENIRVLTQAFNHSYLIQYNLKGIKDYKPLLNYFIYYKIGAISLKNEHLDELPPGTVPDGYGTENKYINNVAVLTGLGAGVNYQLSNNLSLSSSLELNRSSDAAEAVYQIQTIFYNSSHSVNSYLALSFGVSYGFNFSKKKKSSYFEQRTETEKQLIQSKIKKKKGQASPANTPDWYDDKMGK
ncbi:MAG: hypothetical protein JZU47_04550 [Prolixibacteraceae bacterium]|nr:hypothetical protein [Prolixibacteraceae bacterium]